MMHWLFSILCHHCTWIKQVINLFKLWRTNTHISCGVIENTTGALSVNSPFPFLSSMENRQEPKRKGWKSAASKKKKKRFPGYTCQETVWGRWDSVSSVVLKCDGSKISTYFPRHFISFVVRSSQQTICVGLHASQAPQLQATTFHHWTPAAHRGPEAWLLNYQTQKDVLSNSVLFTVEPSTLQESAWTWRPWVCSQETGQVYLFVKKGLPG